MPFNVAGSLSGNMDGIFDWQIQTKAVVTTPEPTTLAPLFSVWSG
jgi:hypothetical protein